MPSGLKTGRKNSTMDVVSYHKSLSFPGIRQEVGVRAIVWRGKRRRKYDLYMLYSEMIIDLI
jgi:hypothetical protein